MMQAHAIMLALGVGVLVIAATHVVINVPKGRTDPSWVPLDAWRDEAGAWRFALPEPGSYPSRREGSLVPQAQVALEFTDGRFPDHTWFGVKEFHTIALHANVWPVIDDGVIDWDRERQSDSELRDAAAAFLEAEVVPPGMRRSEYVRHWGQGQEIDVFWERRSAEIRLANLAWTFGPGIFCGSLVAFCLLHRRTAR